MDDMRADELRYMPNVARLARRGTQFSACRLNTPLCSPYRTGFLTGRDHRYHGVLNQSDPERPRDSNNQVATWLAAEGVTCGVIGKIISTLYVKAGPFRGWDWWRGFSDDAYAQTGFEVDDGTNRTVIEKHVDAWMGETASRFISGRPEPWFLWMNPTAPHSPHVTPPGLEGRWDEVDWPIPADDGMAGKPSWITSKPPLTAEQRTVIQDEERKRLQEITSTDRMLGRIIELVESDDVGDTTIVITSDNGQVMGEFRFAEKVGMKNLLYEPCLRVPLVVFGPDFVAGATVDAPVTGQDITALAVDLFGASAPYPLDGVSLATIARDPADFRSRKLLHHKADDAIDGDDDGMPEADGITTIDRKLVRHVGQSGRDRYELYDLDVDPAETRNTAFDKDRTAERDVLERDLDALLGA